MGIEQFCMAELEMQVARMKEWPSQRIFFEGAVGQGSCGQGIFKEKATVASLDRGKDSKVDPKQGQLQLLLFRLIHL